MPLRHAGPEFNTDSEFNMTSYIKKSGYFARQAVRRLQRAAGCPNCGHTGYETHDRKALVTELRDCMRCRLMYRYPTDQLKDSVKFYQEDYQQGFTTDMPGAAALKQLLDIRFAGHEKDYAPLIALIASLGITPSMRLFDFGCSWGYGSWQFTQAGYAVKSFEISRPRARYAREKLSVDVIDDATTLKEINKSGEGYDLFFSNHVMEHIPSPSDAVATARRLLKPGGLFVAITPNGTLDYRAVAPEGWHRSWGKVHPNMLNEKFWAREFTEDQYFIGSLPDSLDIMPNWATNPKQVQDSLTGSQLICLAKIDAR